MATSTQVPDAAESQTQGRPGPRTAMNQRPPLLTLDTRVAHERLARISFLDLGGAQALVTSDHAVDRASVWRTRCHRHPPELKAASVERARRAHKSLRPVRSQVVLGDELVDGEPVVVLVADDRFALLVGLDVHAPAVGSIQAGRRTPPDIRSRRNRWRRAHLHRTRSNVRRWSSGRRT
jgi:hypothetical protein